jgi:hypothetical protein
MGTDGNSTVPRSQAKLFAVPDACSFVKRPFQQLARAPDGQTVALFTRGASHYEACESAMECLLSFFAVCTFCNEHSLSATVSGVDMQASQYH